MKKNMLKMTALSLGIAAMLGFSQDAEAAVHQYKVQKGDTLFKIAEMYGTTVAALKKVNGLHSNTIHPGNKLTIVKSVTVKKGDTLYRISKQYGMTVGELKNINKLKSNAIYPGQTLYVSGNKAADYDALKVQVSLTVKSGYTFDKEEPGKYILQYKKDGTYFVRIEVLDAKASISSIKKNSSDYLQATGRVKEFPTNNGHPFYKGASFFLHASNSKVGQNVVVKTINGKKVRFTIHYANKEASEGITPVMIELLQTATLK
jgi:LysM repeat protein